MQRALRATRRRVGHQRRLQPDLHTAPPGWRGQTPALGRALAPLDAQKAPDALPIRWADRYVLPQFSLRPLALPAPQVRRSRLPSPQFAPTGDLEPLCCRFVRLHLGHSIVISPLGSCCTPRGQAGLVPPTLARIGRPSILLPPGLADRPILSHAALFALGHKPPFPTHRLEYPGPGHCLAPSLQQLLLRLSWSQTNGQTKHLLSCTRLCCPWIPSTIKQNSARPARHRCRAEQPSPQRTEPWMRLALTRSGYSISGFLHSHRGSEERLSATSEAPYLPTWSGQGLLPYPGQRHYQRAPPLPFPKHCPPLSLEAPSPSASVPRRPFTATSLVAVSRITYSYPPLLYAIVYRLSSGPPPVETARPAPCLCYHYRGTRDDKVISLRPTGPHRNGLCVDLPREPGAPVCG
jgi:hypothetical protein